MRGVPPEQICKFISCRDFRLRNEDLVAQPVAAAGGDYNVFNAGKRPRDMPPAVAGVVPGGQINTMIDPMDQIHRQGMPLELPGGYSVGDKVVSTIVHSNGSKKLSIGDVGTVGGPSTNPSAADAAQRVTVHFPSYGGSVNMKVTQIRHDRS